MWREAIEKARVDEQAYAPALAKALKKFVCSSGGNAIYVLSGTAFRIRIWAAGTAAASDLIVELADKNGKDCPVAASAHHPTGRGLLQIRQRIGDVEKAGK